MICLTHLAPDTASYRTQFFRIQLKIIFYLQMYCKWTMQRTRKNIRSLKLWILHYALLHIQYVIKPKVYDKQITSNIALYMSIFDLHAIVY